MTSYHIKLILCSGILIVIYHLFLDREKMFVYNRFYLLAALVFSIFAPLISFDMETQPVFQPIVNQLPDLDQELKAIPYFDPPNVEFREALIALSFDWMAMLYFIIAGLLLLRFAFNIFKIFKLKSKCRLHIVSDATLVLVPEDIVTFTFLHYIFIPQNRFENQQIRDEIVTHELAHVRQKHTLDILCIELLQAVMWFNPFLFLYKKAIRLNHEFLADEAVLKEHQDVKKYQLLLLDSILDVRHKALTSSFNYSITKKRLAMMTKIKNLNRAYVKQTVTVVLSAILAIVFSEKIYSQVEAGGEKIAAVLPGIGAAAFQKPETRNKPVDQQEKIQGIVPGPGISEKEINEFYGTIEKHTRYVTAKKGRTDPIVEMPSKVEDRMYELFSRMDREQLLASQDSGVMVFQMPIPVKKSPTPEIFENWKREDIFGIWLNGKKMPNSILNKYTPKDIVEYDLSKLYGAALKGRNYKYQLELTTDEYFDKTYQARINNRVFVSRVGWVGERPKSFAKKPKV